MKKGDLVQGLSPGDRQRQIARWWDQLRAGEDPGATTWEVLDPLERQVTDCLGRDPPDLDRADRLTAKAFLLVAGQEDL
jgi:hypothetical protein